MIKISVIVAAYNTEKYIETCLDSIINQTYKNIEIICVDDGSTDRTGIIMDEYKERYDYITAIHQENLGITKSRKIGIQQAKGEYICYIDSDDWIDLQMFEKMMDIISDTNVEAVCTGYVNVKENSVVKKQIPLEEGIYYGEGKTPLIQDNLYSDELSIQLLPWTVWGYLYKKECIYDKIMYVDDSIFNCEDAVAAWGALLEINKLYVMKEALYFHRERENSLTHGEDVNRMISLLKAYEQLKCLFQNKGNKDAIIALKKYFFIASQNCRIFTNENPLFFLFPYEKIEKGSKIVLYGAGDVGKSYYRQIKVNHYCDIVLWCDKSYEVITGKNYDVKSPDKLKEVEYDKLLIAIMRESSAKDILKDLNSQYNIDESKVVIYAPKHLSKYTDFD